MHWVRNGFPSYTGWRETSKFPSLNRFDWSIPLTQSRHLPLSIASLRPDSRASTHYLMLHLNNKRKRWHWNHVDRPSWICFNKIPITCNLYWNKYHSILFCFVWNYRFQNGTKLVIFGDDYISAFFLLWINNISVIICFIVWWFWVRHLFGKYHLLRLLLLSN